MNSQEIEGIDWSINRLLPAFQTPEHLTIYDMRGTSQTAQLSASTMAGLINRPRPQVYVIYNDDDAFWHTELLPSVPQHLAPAKGDAALEQLLYTFRSHTQGIIIYDPDFVDSINIATTLAGERAGILVSPTQAQDLQARHKLPVLDDLRTYHWRSRTQAYRWAQQNLLTASSARLLAGLDPKIASGLRSFLVATRTFVYYLDSRDFLPDVTAGLRTERRLMQQIISSFPAGAVHLGWFIDESSGVSITSSAAMPVLATDYMNNLEVWTSVQPATPPLRMTPPLQAHLQEPVASKVYLSFTLSEGDNLQYNQRHMRRLWANPARGSIPIGWTISPLLLEAAPSIAAYYTRTATPNDEFIAGPSGAGYMFPSRWPAERLQTFLENTGRLMQQMNLTTLEVLDTDFFQSIGLAFISYILQKGMAFAEAKLQRQFTQVLSPFGVRGILSGSGKIIPSWTISSGSAPIYHNLGLAGSIKATVRLIKIARFFLKRRPLFLNVYILAWSMTPSDLRQVVDQLGSEYEIVTPGTLLAALAKAK